MGGHTASLGSIPDGNPVVVIGYATSTDNSSISTVKFDPSFLYVQVGPFSYVTPLPANDSSNHHGPYDVNWDFDNGADMVANMQTLLVAGTEIKFKDGAGVEWSFTKTNSDADVNQLCHGRNLAPAGYPGDPYFLIESPKKIMKDCQLISVCCCWPISQPT